MGERKKSVDFVYINEGESTVNGTGRKTDRTIPLGLRYDRWAYVTKAILGFTLRKGRWWIGSIGGLFSVSKIEHGEENIFTQDLKLTKMFKEFYLN